MAIIVLIAAGIALIGLIVLMNLSPSDQKKLTQAIQVFDLHEQVQKDMHTIAFLLEANHEFYEQFYVGFSQTAVLRDQDSEFLLEMGHQTALLLNQFATYSDQIAMNYNRSNQAAERVSTGQVAGASLINKNFAPPSENFLTYEPPRVEWQAVLKIFKPKN